MPIPKEKKMANNYYEDYLARTNGNLRESTLLKKEKKDAFNKKLIIGIIFLALLLAGGFYLWQKTESPIRPIEIIKPKIVDENISKVLEENTSNITEPSEENTTDMIENNISESSEENVSDIIENNSTEIAKPKHPLEILLMEAIKKSSKQEMSIDAKRDTFNKIILSSSTSKPSKITKAIDTIFQEAKDKKRQQKEPKIEEAKEKKDKYEKEMQEEARLRKEEMRYVTVKSGDTLYKIAKRVYGDSTHYKIIFEANSEMLKTATDLSIGQKLRVPKLKKAQ
jgi:LysM repeat protein